MISDRIATIVAILSLLFLAWQTILLRKTYEYTSDWQEKEKAAELAKMYKDEIIPSISYISSVLKHTGIMELLSNIRSDNILLFNSAELFRLTNKNIEQLVQEKERDLNTIGIILCYRSKLAQTYNRPLHSISETLIEKWINAERSQYSDDKDVNEMKEQERTSLHSALWYEFYWIVNNTLNTLEYFSMNFNSKVADDTVVFQSLHQTYIVLVQMLYYYIAIQNIYDKDKFYTNVVDLYEKWIKTDLENEKKSAKLFNSSSPVKK